MAGTIRDTLTDTLRRVLGPAVHIIPYQDSADELDRLTVMVKQTTVAPLAEAPRGQLRVDVVLTFIHPATDMAIAEPALDQWVPDSLADLHGSWLTWTLATKRLFQSTRICYDVDAFLLTTIRNDQPAAPAREE